MLSIDEFPLIIKYKTNVLIIIRVPYHEVEVFVLIPAHDKFTRNHKAPSFKVLHPMSGTNTIQGRRAIIY